MIPTKSENDTIRHAISPYSYCVSGRRIRQTIAARRRRWNNSIQLMALGGLVIVMTIVDLVPETIIRNRSMFGARNFVSCLSTSSSQRRQPFVLQEFNHNGPFSMHHTQRRRMRRIPQTICSQIASSSSEGSSRDSTAGSKLKGFFVRLLTGEKASSARLRKPKWLEESSKLSVLPTWLFHLRPSVQMVVTAFLYLFHTAVLTQNSVILPIQVFPNERGNFQTIGLDT